MPAAVAAAFVAFVASDVPVLRHDWFPIVPSLSFAVDNVTGWDPTGMGTVIAYPASFILIFARSFCATLLGSYATHLVYYTSCALLITFGAARLARVLGGAPPARLAAALFAAFNPWTYTELVAGHSWMLLSYGGTYWLIAECCARERRERRLIPLVLVIAPQVQFLVVDFVFYVCLSLRMRSWRSLLAIGSMLLPVFVGVEISRTVLRGIPLTLEWERSQSVEPLRALLLRGYFTHYDGVLAPFFEWACWLVVALAVTGVALIAIDRRRELWLIPFAALPLIWSFGLNGPFNALFSWTILHVSEAALFRELYDLLGFVAIGYVAFCAVATERRRALGAVWLVAGAAMLVAWILAPPGRYWVGSRDLPAVSVPSSANTRFALMPALFPAGFHGRGSGTDPDLYARAGNVTPVNEAYALYPVSAALGSYLRDGRVERLAALSVERIVARPWLQTDPSIRYQFALPAPAWLFRTVSQSRAIATALPQLSLSAMPEVGTLDANLGAGNVLLGDASKANGALVPTSWHALSVPQSVTANGVYVAAADGWVDARLAFVEEPELAQSYGGALTTSRTAVLPLEAGSAALVFVRGSLQTPAGATLASTTNGYRWIALPPAVSGVRCVGLCVVAARAARLPVDPLDPPVHPSRAIGFRALTPWLVLATLPAGGAELLRYNVTFDDNWVALYADAPLSHLRIDGVVNGWLLPARHDAATVILIEGGAVCVAFAELIAVLFFLLAVGPQIGAVFHLVRRRKSVVRTRPSIVADRR
ncbi:MAG: hypothetical protein IAI49_12985 [Candidatus Eremiobacteraeota bacterium]|nr:hypothetical protein [Candidatus Eremiobacteraeota bacterium]